MLHNEPIIFEPLFMERVWGGRRLETLYAKRLPHGVRVGESWELVDRADYQSVVHDGPLQGATLHELWAKRRAEIFGDDLPDTPRFPLLFKLLDCQDRLSVQVHPPLAVAARLGGEAKSEMWFIMHSALDSDLYAGLKRDVTRGQFDAALVTGHVADLIHRIPTHVGDAFFIPSGRIHAIGAGNVVFEVMQNSDTTYRVFDWNRLGLDGKPRELHIDESLASINFDDPEPDLVAPDGDTVVACEHFRVERWEIDGSRSCGTERRFAVFTVIDGEIACGSRTFSPGAFFLVPARAALEVSGRGSLLRTSF
ncbi:MAG: type I phosphomannose isomerase catalytic subunit [Chthoniobacteraceae bacterium]